MSVYTRGPIDVTKKLLLKEIRRRRIEETMRTRPLKISKEMKSSILMLLIGVLEKLIKLLDSMANIRTSEVEI